MSASLLARLRALLNLPARMETQVDRLRKDVEANLDDLRRTLKAQREHGDSLWQKQKAKHDDLREELASTRADLKQRLRQQQLQLGRVAELLEHGSNGSGHEISSHQIPMDVPPAMALPPVADWEWLVLDRCPGCGTAERTAVCEWNKSILLDQDIPEDAMRYDYALCHGCGMVYATRRPVGATYRGLVDAFPETIGRDPTGGGNPLLYPFPLSDADRQRYRDLAAGGVFVSDHTPQAHIEGVFRDRFDQAGHLEVLAGLLDLRGARVLEIRSRAGTIVSGLRRQFGASVVAMPIFESQQFVLREIAGVECSDVIDYDAFTIPVGGPFDLIVANHMLTHVVRPDRFFEQLRQHMRVGGHLYLYNELDEGEFLVRGKSLINSLNAIHLQTFDRASVMRMLKANGFEVTFIKWESDQLCLARYTGNRDWSPMPADERHRRVKAYALARVRAILRAPEAVRGRFSAVWDEALAQGVAAGVAQFDDRGRLRLVRER